MSVSCAVYCVLPKNVAAEGVQVTALLVRLSPPVAVALGATSAWGAVTVIAALVIGSSSVTPVMGMNPSLLPLLYEMPLTPFIRFQ